MKKMISFVLAAVMSAMVAVPAFAADAETKKDDGANTWTTSGQNASYADKMMTMIAYAPVEGEITVDSIQYIDQTTADSTGAYSFSSYIPKELPTETSYSVKVGSEALDAAIDAGTIEKIEKVDVPVTGTIKTQSTKANVTVGFYKSGATEATVSGETEDGALSVDVAPGTYDVVISRPGYLKYTITGVEVTDGLQLGEVTLLAGDVNADATVNIMDVTDVVKAFKASSTGTDGRYRVEYDFDVDGTVNIIDVTDMVKNFKKTATTISFTELNK